MNLAELLVPELYALIAGEHESACASRHSYMVGGISLDVNVRPNAHEVRPACDCVKQLAQAEIERRTAVWMKVWRDATDGIEGEQA